VKFVNLRSRASWCFDCDRTARTRMFAFHHRAVSIGQCETKVFVFVVDESWVTISETNREGVWASGD